MRKRDDCILWDGATYSNGYGKLYREGRPRKGKRKRVTELAHRVSYQTHIGPIGDALIVHNRHCSGDRRCVNPAHLTKVSAPKKMIEWKARKGYA